MPLDPQKLTQLPEKPGVYLFKDSSGRVLYVGKAKNLKNRISSYFHKSVQLEPIKKIMLRRLADLEYIIVDSETEALFLETNLIKRHHPDFNVIMKDDKYFLYLKINLKEDFPTLTTVRRLERDGAKYFGPYTSAKIVRSTIKFLKKVFPVKTCLNKPSDPCFEHRIHRCAGHQISPDSQAEYKKIIKNFIRFLEGQTEDVVSNLEQEMAAASDKMDYEKAAAYRDRLSAIRQILEKQKVVLAGRDNADFLGLTRDKTVGCINLLIFRDGKLIGQKNLILKNIEHRSDSELTASFIEQYYTQSTEHPKTIYVRQSPDRLTGIQKLLQLKILTARRGRKSQLLKLSETNGRNELNKATASWQTDGAKAGLALNDLVNKLKLEKQPRRIETYDISNIQGENAVGSMTVFIDGLPKKTEYRKFIVRSFRRANDPGMLAEVVERRFKHILSKTKQYWTAPDLIILDGGKGQLNTVTSRLKKTGMIITIIALAKRLEEIYLPGARYPIKLPADSPSIFLLQRMRDEAHRFAIGFYRRTHRKKIIKSQLDEVPGIGPKRKRKLLKRFGSVEEIKKASASDLTIAVGPRLSQQLRETLN